MTIFITYLFDDQYPIIIIDTTSIASIVKENSGPGLKQ